MRRFRLLGPGLSCIALLSVLAGCGRGQATPAAASPATLSPAITPVLPLTPTLSYTPSPTAAPTVRPPATLTPVPLESGAVAVYFQVPLGSGTSYHTVGGQTLEVKGSGGGVFRYLPGQDNVTLVEDYVSPDYARNVLRPYTVDGRLFLVQIWPDSRSADFDEFDPIGVRRLARNAARVKNNSDYSSWSEYAVVGSRLYYQTKRRSDVWARGGYSGGGLWVKDLGSDARAKELLSYDDLDNYGSLHSAGGNLYRVNIAEDMRLVQINRIDLTSGKVAQVVARLSVGNPGDYKNWSFAVDREAFYFAMQEKDAAVVHLLRLPWIDAEKGNPSLVLSHTLADERDRLLGLDADEGYVVLELFTWGKGSFVVYDHNAGTTTTIKPGGDPRHVQILQLR